MKRLLALALAGIMVFSLTACQIHFGGWGDDWDNNSDYNADGSYKTYTVRYDPGAFGKDEGYDDVKYHNDDFYISSWVFYRPGYRQMGWSLTDGGPKDFELEGIVTLNEDFTLYPFWVLGVGSKDRPFDDCFFDLTAKFYDGPYALTFEGSSDSGTEKENSTTGTAIYKPGYFYSELNTLGQTWDYFYGWLPWDQRSKTWYVVAEGIYKEYWYLNGGSGLTTTSHSRDEMERGIDGVREGAWSALNAIRSSGTGLDGGGSFVRTGSGQYLGRDCVIFRQEVTFVIKGYFEYWIDKETGFCLKETKDLTTGEDRMWSQASCTSIRLGSAVNNVTIPSIPAGPDYFDEGYEG